MRTCPSCGGVTGAARFCPQCGFAVASELPPEPPATATDEPPAPPRPSAPVSAPDPAGGATEQVVTPKLPGPPPLLRPLPEELEPRLPPLSSPAHSQVLASLAPTMASITAPAPAEPTTLPPPASVSAQRETRPAEDSRAFAEALEASRPLEDDSPIGHALGGRYRVDWLIGIGGFGAVYRATHLALGEPVAVKVLHPEWAVQPEFRARFRREAVALARLRHPGIAAVHDFGEDGRRLYLVMDLVAGTSLSRQITLGPDVLTPDRVAHVFAQVLAVLAAAHAAGIVHRDMKPENVLLHDGLEGPDTVKVLDFGIALLDDQERSQRLTATNSVQGTPLYMSPEQCRGRDVGPATDVYAVGAMLFEALAGVPPFSGDTSTDVMVKHMFMMPPPVEQRGWRRAPPPGLEALAQWALRKKPEERPAATALREALLQAAQKQDQVSRAAEEVDRRVSGQALTREERSLPAAPPSQVVTVPRPRDGAAARGVGPQVVLWRVEEPRAERLIEALAVNGLVAMRWNEGAPPPASIGGEPVKAVVVAGEAAEALSRALRASETVFELPLLAIDVVDVDRFAPLIRAGASDAALGGVGEEELCRKVWRLVQRGR